MTNYTIREDAQAFIARFAEAPDLASHANLMDELKERYTTLATQTQMLAESNERWANESREKSSAVEDIINGLLNLYPDEDTQPDAIQELAELFDISLTHEIEFEATIRVTGTITAPRTMSIDSALAKLDAGDEPIKVLYHWDGDVSLDDSSAYLDGVEATC